MRPLELSPLVPLAKPVPLEPIIGILYLERRHPLSLIVSAPLHDHFPDEFGLPQVHLDPVLPYTDIPRRLQIRCPAVTVRDVSAVRVLEVFETGFVSDALGFTVVARELGRGTDWETL